MVMFLMAVAVALVVLAFSFVVALWVFCVA